MRAIRAYELDLYRHLATASAAIDGVAICGLHRRTRTWTGARRRPRSRSRASRRAPRPSASATRGIAVWDGDFYATGLIERLGLAPDGVLRIGLTHYNTARRGRPARRRARGDRERGRDRGMTSIAPAT